MNLLLLILMQLVARVIAEDDVLMYEPSGTSGGNAVWSTNWYYTNQWSPGSGSGSTKAYSYCLQTSNTNPVSWLRTNFIDVKDSLVVHFQVKFTMKNCALYNIPNCKQTFDLHHYQRDTQAGGTSGHTDQADPLKTPANFPFIQTITGTKLENQLVNTITVPVTMTKKGVYFALKSNGGCYSIKAVKVIYQTCPATVVNLTMFSLTKTQLSSISVLGECVSNAKVSNLNGSKMYLECQNDGQWNLSKNKFECECVPGFQNNQKLTACQECTIGSYKDTQGNTPCKSCPLHSSTGDDTAQTKCDCNESFYRAPSENIHADCTALPSQPQNLTLFSVNQTSTKLRWSKPQDTGNRNDVYYSVSCDKCSDDAPCEPCDSKSVQFEPSDNLTGTSVQVSGLTPFSSYLFTVSALNGVSSQQNKPFWKKVNISVMTNESVPEAPTILTTGATEEEIFVSWSMDPSKITCELCNYQVCYYAEGKRCEENQDIKYPVSNYTIKGLQPNTKYKLKVRAKGCRTGYGPWSYEVTKQTLGQLLQGDMLIIISAGGVIFVLLIVAVILVVFICKRRRNSDRDASKDALNELALLPREGHKNYIDPCAYDDPEEALKSFAKEIPMTSIKMDKLIGGGEFGEVYKGDLQLPDATPSYPVAIKVLKPNAKKKDRDDFLSEASIMGQFKDPNVVNLEGVVTKGSRIMIVTEFMSNGSLDNFLKQNDGQLSVLQLLGMARGISSGMKYLSEISFIHRDLAARNILVNENLACKVADFGLSRELEDSEEGLESEYETRGGKIPVRWTAPEAIQFRKFSTASDVWSYGILLWETLSFGQRPYWDWGNFEVIERVETGYRLPPPMGCPKVVHQIMLDCWENDRVARPKFVDIVRRLDELIRSPDLLDDKSSRLSQVIKPIEVDVSTTSIQDWLDELKMGQYIENFTNAGYTSLNQVALMRENDLNNIGIRLVGHRHKLNTSISAMQKKAKRQASLLI